MFWINQKIGTCIIYSHHLDMQRSYHKKLPINGHTMVLVAYDPGNVYKNQVYEWGFINSWNVGGDIWWLRDRDVKSLWLDIVEIKK
jgi:hypothetical protein